MRLGELTTVRLTYSMDGMEEEGSGVGITTFLKLR